MQDNSPNLSPWLARRDWASGEIPDHAAGNTAIACLFALVWNTTVAAWILGFDQPGHDRGDSPTWFTASFVIIGLGSLIWAVRSTVRAVKFGKSTFGLQTLPAEPGKNLAGTIHVTRPLHFEGGLRLTLRCVLLTRADSRKKSGFFEEIVWEATQTLDGLPPSPNGSDIPVFFNIPADARPSNNRDPNRQIVWRLEAQANSAIVNYVARFEVPVFLTGNASDGDVAKATPIDAAKSYRQKEMAAAPQQMEHAGIDFQPLASGGVKIHFAAARNKSAATMTSFFALIWLGVTVGMVLVGRSMGWLIFRLLWYIAGAGINGLIALLLCSVALAAWLVSTDLTVDRGTVTIRKSFGLLRRQRTFAATDILEVISSRSGSSGGVPYFAIKLAIKLKVSGKQNVLIADFMQRKDYAAWLAKQIADRLGVATGEESDLKLPD